ncbi:MAG: sulfotransferase [Sandarakinorhabdus sp.]|nr:sulfotransferase [Sandarakinorhabdus sp.]
MGQSYDAEELIAEAMHRTGLDRFDSDSFREGLDILLGDVNRAPYTEAGHQRMHANLVDLLANRLKVTDWLERHPDLLDRPIERPVFVFGIPRTGTTLVSNLLACDPARRSALSWEIDDPVPPATGATLKSDPRALARLEQERAMLAARPEMGKYYRGSAVYPNECIFFMAHDFKALALESRGRLPNYRDWLFSTDMTSAYRYHRRFLQLLQADAPGSWNLKMPSHCLWIDTILSVYPDARLVWTHRDPFTATGSFCSIIAMAHRAFTGTVDTQWVAENCRFQAGEHVNRLMDARARHGDRLLDIHYADLVRDPISAMRSLYAGLGDDFTPEAEAGMRAWLADNPQEKFGRHEYRLEQYGLSVAALEPVFADYLGAHDVAREG